MFFEKVMEVIILIDYFIFITVRVFKYLLLTILIICKNFFILFSILFMVRFAFTNIYINVTFNDDVNTILDGTLPVASMAGVRIDYWQERSMSVSDTPKEDTESLDYIFRNYIVLTLSYFFGNIFCKNKIINTTRLLLSIFIIFVSVYKCPSNQSDSDLKYCSKFEFYHAESVKLQDNLGIINRNTNLAFFAISKLRNKPAHFLKFYQILLILSGDISLNPGPCQTQLNDDKTWDPLKTKGLHLWHLNVNSLLSKIDEIRDIANRIKPAVLGITESKLDSSVTNMEVNINGYSIIRNDRNRHGGGVACYVKNDLCFNTKKIFPISIEHVFFEILIPKVKPIAVGIFYRPPNSNDFLNLLSNSFQQIDLNKQEIYLLGDFNINLFQNGKFLLKENQSGIAWYPPNINKKLKTRLQAAQNKCIRFCLKLDDRFRLKSKEFERINWLPVQERISQCAVCNVYKFFSKHSPDYFEELFFPTKETAIGTRSSFQKLKIPRRKTNIGLKSLSYTGPSLWNNLNENIKRSSSINDFKHKIKEFYFEELKKTKHES